MRDDGPGRGRPLKAEATPAILAAAFRLLAEHGVDRMTMEAVAAESGVSKATVYRRWRSKDELIIDAVREMGRRPPPGLGSKDPRAGAVTVLRNLAGMLADPVAGRVLARLVAEAVGNPALSRAWRETVVTPRRAAVATLVRRGVEAGQLPEATDVEATVDMMIGPLFYRHLVSGGPLEDLPELIVDTVWGPAR